MKTIIAYASKSGTAKRCAERLAERIPGSTLVDLHREKPDPSGYDQVIVGGSVRIGALHRDAKQYLDGAKPVLLKKRLAIFLCAGNEEGVEKVLENNVDPELRAHAERMVSFGGELNPEHLGGFERMMMKMVTKVANSEKDKLPKLFPERVDALAELFK